jgi:hypothetical protein
MVSSFLSSLYVALVDEKYTAYEEALTTTSLIRPYLARALLGWQPRKAGLVDGLATYYAAYLASRD